MVHVDQAVFERSSRLGRVKQWVERHVREEIAVPDLARVAGLESKYFSTFFRRKTGVRCKAWLDSVRIRRATEIMRATDESISRVARAAGFRQLRTFQRVFKRHTLLTPREYRARVRSHLRPLTTTATNTIGANDRYPKNTALTRTRACPDFETI